MADKLYLVILMRKWEIQAAIGDLTYTQLLNSQGLRTEGTLNDCYLGLLHASTQI